MKTPSEAAKIVVWKRG